MWILEAMGSVAQVMAQSTDPVQAFSAGAGYDAETLRRWILSLLMCGICVWATWAIYGRLKAVTENRVSIKDFVIECLVVGAILMVVLTMLWMGEYGAAN